MTTTITLLLPWYPPAPDRRHAHLHGPIRLVTPTTRLIVLRDGASAEISR
jgi:hypothetical protein